MEKDKKITKAKLLGRREGTTAQGRAGMSIYCGRNEGRRNRTQGAMLRLLSCSVTSSSLQPHGLQPTRLLCPWGISRQEYWHGQPIPSPGDLPNPRIKQRSPASHTEYLPAELPGEPGMKDMYDLFNSHSVPGHSKEFHTSQSLESTHHHHEAGITISSFYRRNSATTLQVTRPRSHNQEVAELKFELGQLDTTF